MIVLLQKSLCAAMIRVEIPFNFVTCMYGSVLVFVFVFVPNVHGVYFKSLMC